ncbi:hypothetical protein NEOLEDRAFT_571153 [Neolentinus lepideus HHB14362 ss-1]|uniref:Uncharacterized protein n=1 Tax=Neolentinus lepideus HHB14362 ss-1 TaxID=1314782 RepID=A0A165R049_9AGAM|nr:hypothetical protein NEOLEDRAFT_571153 [Neolentinus lepideus HHB14362 ss-1]
MFVAPALGIFDFILILFSGVNIVLLATLGRRPRLVLGIINSSLMLLRSVVQTSFVLYKFNLYARLIAYRNTSIRRTPMSCLVRHLGYLFNSLRM